MSTSPVLPSNFVELDTRTDPDGLQVVITERTDTGKISFAFFRVFERVRGGPVQRSGYMAPHHIAAIRRQLDRLERDLPLLEDQARARLRVQVQK